MHGRRREAARSACSILTLEENDGHVSNKWSMSMVGLLSRISTKIPLGMMGKSKLDREGWEGFLDESGR